MFRETQSPLHRLDNWVNYQKIHEKPSNKQFKYLAYTKYYIPGIQRKGKVAESLPSRKGII